MNSQGTNGDGHVVGTVVDLDGRRFYRIANYDAMDPFFMTIVGASDVWLFISSTGGLTAGRVHAERALFPYYTDDKITENSSGTGGLTVLHVRRAGGEPTLWVPFAPRRPGDTPAERSLYKDVLGTTLVFEETRADLGLRLRVSWQTSAEFGVVRGCELTSLSDEETTVELVDGFVNLLPDGASVTVQNSLSNLLDAYKRTEVDSDTGLGLITLNSTLTDLAEPSESLRTTVAWNVGLTARNHLLSTRQLDRFSRGEDIVGEHDVRGERGAYLVHADATLPPGASRTWHTVGDVRYDAVDVVALRERLRDPQTLAMAVADDVADTRRRLERIVATTDGVQATGDEIATMHHAANVLFNDMRGGVPADGYTVDVSDVREFITTRSRTTATRHAALFDSLPAQLTIEELRGVAAVEDDPDLIRLVLEYLPFTFSRRHGDPSRPWNKFSIVLRDDHGNRRLDYEGNWRDIFQNWEALSWSYPDYLDGMIAVFLDATTADGYNPYRISRSGIDWEVPEPGNPWSNIGYWGDHQIIYLLRLLETVQRFDPGRLKVWVGRRLFTHADVPYRIASYTDTLKDPYSTISFDDDRHATVARRVAAEGADGRLVHGADGDLVRVTLAEKLLLLALAKLVNFVPGGGIWMNTQRPEWNDANNALAGRGLSVVTLAYLRRYLDFVADLLEDGVEVGIELAQLATDVAAVLDEHAADLAASSMEDTTRRQVMDRLGEAGTSFRERVYSGVSGDTTTLSAQRVRDLLTSAIQAVDGTLSGSWREDGLIHSYNVVDTSGDEARVKHLAPMLEGQVAILSSGLLSAEKSLAVLDALRHSPLYRPDQHSYILYPNKDLPGFLAKNTFRLEEATSCPLLAELVEAGERSIIRQDVLGDVHFAGHLRNARGLEEALDELAQHERWRESVERDRDSALTLFEDLFRHGEFTGRSGTFFAFEGLGSVYWHMVAKLMLAVQETLDLAVEHGEDPDVCARLAAAYADVQAGIGYRRTPKEYGAFPTDPYSHTPAGKGAKQPGMTGQVKEEVLTRRGELGLAVDNGRIVVRPHLLSAAEWAAGARLNYLDVNGEPRTLDVDGEGFAMTFCQVPVLVTPGQVLRISARLADGTTEHSDGATLSRDLSAGIFRRDGRVEMLEVTVPRND